MSDDNETIVYKYTRAQALEDGFQVDVTEVAKEAGFVYPVFLTRTVFDKYVKKGVNPDEAWRLWNVLTTLFYAIKSQPMQKTILFKLYVKFDVRSARNVDLEAACGPYDIDDPRPAITVMLPGED